MAAINLDIGGNTGRLDRDIQKTVNRVYNINLKTRGDQPLGRITGQVNEFNKSLDASNARVIAFGASAGIIFGVQRAFSALVGATIEVQKSLQDINVILNVSAQNLQKFGGELFNIAKNTGQSFQEVAKAATEFSRQGLGVEETLKRTNEALILSRLSGLDTAKSVEALTAAVNSFASQAVTATEVVNKFANVDAAFAVSSADLAEALARVGSSAAQSGVSLNELIAIVTSAQQTTARGGAVIGNSFKTIFTRLQRGKVVDLLGTLGISDTNASGELKSTIQLLQDLGKVYDTLGARQQAAVAEQVGGVFQINILKAALSDLGKEYSIYSSALGVAAGTTDQAIRRNEELNKTYAAQLNALQENARQIASAAGERLIGPSIDRLVGGSNTLLGGINESDGQGVGAVLGKGILDGLGQFISGPGIALIGGVLFKLFSDLGKFATGSFRQLLGLNTAATQQKDLQASISQILAKNPDLLNLALKGEQGINTAANTLLASLRNQTLELQNQEKVAQRIAKAFATQAGVRVTGGIPIVPAGKTGKTGKAAGYIPNFAEVSQAIELGAPSSVQSVSGVGKIGGKSFEANNKEFQIPDFGGTGETAVIPKYGGGIKEATKMIARGESGSVLDKSSRNRAKGFVPSFAVGNINTPKNSGKKKYPAGIVTQKLKQTSNVANAQGAPKVGENFDTYSPFSLDIISLGSKASFEKDFDKQLGNLNSKNVADGKKALEYFARNGYSSNQINQLKENMLSNKEEVPSLLAKNKKLVDPKRQLQGLKSSVLGKYFERFAANRMGLGLSQSPTARMDLVDPKSRVPVGEVKFGSINPDNIISKVIETKHGKTKKQNPAVKDDILMPSNFKLVVPNAADGFIPNFAKQKRASKNAIDLGNLDTIPNKLGNKVVSLIHPGLSDGYSLRPATANYLKQDYRGNIPVAGINQKTLKSQLPDLDQNLGNLLVREANQFGQSLGGTNFLKSAKELPNFGAAKGAVGVAFEAGVQTLLQQKIGRKQNAGIDFRNITPRLRSIFNQAPGMYDAKSSPDLTNEVFKKLLNETRPGALVQKSSGQAGKDYAAKRSAAVAELRKEGVTGSVAIRQALRDRFGIVGKAAGYIPNFAAIQDAVSRERAAGVPSNQIYLAQEKALTGANPMGVGVFNKTDEPTAGKRREQIKRKGFGRGFIPNFAIEDLDIEGASAGTGIAAISAQLTGLAFAFAFTGNEFKNRLKELSLATKATAETQRKGLADKIRADRAEARRTSSLGPNARQITRADGTLGGYTGDTRRQSVMAVGGRFESERESVRKQSKPGLLQRGMAFGGTNAFGLAMAAPILGETLKNVIGQETAGDRQKGAFASGLGQVGSFAATGALIAPGPIGAGVGAAIGALLTIPTVVNEFTSELPELTAAAKKSSQELTRFSDLSSKILTSFSQVTALSSDKGSTQALSRAQEALSKNLNELSSAEKNKVLNALKLGTLEEELAKIIEERIKNEKQALQKVALQEAADRTFLGLKGLGTFETSSEKGKEQGKNIEEIFRQAFTSGRTDQESLEVVTKASSAGNLDALQGLLKNLTRGQEVKGKQGLFTQRESLPVFEKALQSLLPETETKADNIKGLLKIADNDTDSFVNILNLLINSLKKAPEELQKNIDLLLEAKKAAGDLAKAQKTYAQNTDNLVSSLSRSISVLNNFIDTLNRFENNEKKFERERSIEQAFTTPKNIAQTVLGPNADLTQQFSLFEQIANNENQRLTAIEGSNQEFKQSFRTNLDKVFGERLVEIQNLKGSGSEGNIKELDTAEKLVKEAAELLRTGAVDINTVLKDSFTDENINPEKLESSLQSAFERAGIDSKESQKILDSIYQSAVVQQNSSLEANRLAKELNIKAATEATNQKVLNSLNQSLKAFGGIETFLNPGEGLAESLKILIPVASGQLKKQRDLEFGIRTGSLTSTGTPEQARNNIGLGQSSLNFIKQLQTISGGAFSPDPSSELFIRATSGLAQSFQNSLSQLEAVLKDPKVDGAFKIQIKEAINSIGGLGSSQEIAQLQMAQETGSALQSTLKGSLSRLQDPAIESLRSLGLDSLADEVARNAKFTTDPVLNVLETQKSLQTSIVSRIELIQKSIASLVARPSASIPGGPTASNAKGFLPAFVSEKRAIRKGVGGAKSSDTPRFLPNLNGTPAFVNSGEQLVDNYMGSRQTAVLTRDMQSAMVAAKGFIPNFANGQSIVTADSFRPISGSVIQDLTDTGKDFVVIRSENPLNDSFRNQTVRFGKGKGSGQIISIDQNDRFSARVKINKNEEGLGESPPKGKFTGAFEETTKRALSEKEQERLIKSYQSEFNRAVLFSKPNNGTGTPADAADILRGLEREFKFNDRNYAPFDTDEGPRVNAKTHPYTDLRNLVRLAQAKIREENLSIESASQDPDFARFLEEDRKKKRGVDRSKDPGIDKEIERRVREYKVLKPNESKKPKSRKTEQPENKADFLSDAFTRATKVTAKLGEYTGLNIGSDNPFGAVGDKPKVKGPGTGPGQAGKPRVPGVLAGVRDSTARFYQPPATGTLFNEATHINQNMPGMTGSTTEEKSLAKAIKDGGGSAAYLKRLKKFADFLDKENNKASNNKKFTFAGASSRSTSYSDTRAFGYGVGDPLRGGLIVSEFKHPEGSSKYIQERASSLNDVFSRGVVNGEITAEEMNRGFGIPIDTANSIVAEIVAIDKQLKEQKLQSSSTPSPTISSGPPAMPGVPQGRPSSIPRSGGTNPRPGVPTQTALPQTPTEIPRFNTSYPGGISPQTARAIVQELDATYDQAIRNSKSPNQSKSWAQTQQRYRLLYSQGKYRELDAFYKGLQKGSNYNSNYGQGTGRRGETVQRFAGGFVPNFAQNYISNLAKLEADLSGEDPAMGYDKKIGRFIYNKGQSKSGNLNEIISKDHPEGLKNAMKNSMKMQKSVGVMNKGSIPNFAVTDQSFSQMEAIFSNNTSALTTLAGGLESLRSTLANFESNFANLNNVLGTRSAGVEQARSQPNINTTTNAPVNVTVNAEGGGDIATAVAVAVKKAIPTIVLKVRAAIGEKIPPTVDMYG